MTHTAGNESEGGASVNDTSSGGENGGGSAIGDGLVNTDVFLRGGSGGDGAVDGQNELLPHRTVRTYT